MERKDFLEFGPFRLDPGRRQLLRDGQAISLPGKAFEVLLVLLQRPGETVTKDDLMKAVWPDTFVEEGNLTQTIFVLRKALGDSDGQPLIITMPRQGYRFAGMVSAGAGPVDPQSSIPISSPRPAGKSPSMTAPFSPASTTPPSKLSCSGPRKWPGTCLTACSMPV